MHTIHIDNPSVYHVERSIIEADIYLENREALEAEEHAAWMERQQRVYDLEEQLKQARDYEVFLAKLAKGEFAGNVKKLKERIKKHKETWE